VTDSLDTLKHLISEKFGIDRATLEHTDQGFESFGIDSLSLAELLFAIEDRFQVRLPDLQLEQVASLSALAATVDDALRTATAG